MELLLDDGENIGLIFKQAKCVTIFEQISSYTHLCCDFDACMMLQSVRS